MEPCDTKMSATGKHHITCAVICKFCVSFGRESRDRPVSSDRASNTVTTLTAVKEPRAVTSTTKIFTSFRSDLFSKHLERNHPAKWGEYQGLRTNDVKTTRFFA